MKPKKLAVVILFLIVATGFFLRFINIENAPPGVYPDEAVNGVDAATANDSGRYLWFYEANNGREGMFMNLVALCFKLVGIGVLGLKLPSIVFGTLAIPGTYLLAKESFQKTRLALMSAFLVSTAFWALNFSRISFRANTLPAILAFSFYFLIRGMRTKKLVDFALSGAIFGLGLHTYISFRIAPAILVVMSVVFFLTRKNFLKDYWKQGVVFITLCFIVASPILYTFYKHPEYVGSRTNNISVFNPEVNEGHFFQAFEKTFALSILKYNIWGDQNWRHNYPPHPVLDPFTGILFTFGLIYAILRFLQLLFLRLVRKEIHPRLEACALLLSWFFIMLAPEFLSCEGNPHALRAIGTLPPVFIFSSLTLEYFLRKSEIYSSAMRAIAISLISLMLLFVGTFNAVKYHIFWANKVETAQSFDKKLMDISGHIQSQSLEKEIFIVVESMQRIPIQLFNWRRPLTSYIYPGEAGQINPQTENFEIILTDYNEEIIASLKNTFSGLETEEVPDQFGLSYYILK